MPSFQHRLLRLWGALPIPARLRWAIVYAAVPKFPVGVTAAILDAEGRLLFFRHTYRDPYPWGLPSGWLEPGEPPERAIAREIAEETALQVADLHLVLAGAGQEVRRLDLVYRGRLAGGDFRPSAEVTAVRWFAPEALPPMMPAQYDMIAQILGALGGWRPS